MDMLVHDPKPTVKGHGSEPGAYTARHLARHGFVSRVVPVRGGLEAEGDALVTAARHGGAAMLALVAYGQSRLREMILVGVTRDLLGGAPLPLLFLHYERRPTFSLPGGALALAAARGALMRILRPQPHRSDRRR